MKVGMAEWRREVLSFRCTWIVCYVELYLLPFPFILVFVLCAQQCDSMILLMKKLDHLSEGMQNIQNSNSCHTNDVRVKEEQQGTKVSLI